MDLKSMLNESSAQRPPRLHTSPSSYDARAAESKPIHESHHHRPASYPPPLQTVESRGQAGPYFGYQSPHQNNLNSASTHASTPGAGAHSAYAQSPGPHPPAYPSRENTVSQNSFHPAFVSSPSVSVQQPPTPGSAHSYQSNPPMSIHGQSAGQHLQYNHAQSPRGSHPPNGQVNPQNRTISPHAPHHHQPATPLGPPISYAKASPQAQRPTSRGLEQSYRRSSHGSSGSIPGREYSQGPLPVENTRSDSNHRNSLPDTDRGRDRERSVSVSPKTIPKAPPQRQTSSASFPSTQRPIVQSPHDTKQMSAPAPSLPDKHTEQSQSTPTNHYIPGHQEQPILTGAPTPGFGPDIVRSRQQTPVQMSSPMSTQRDLASLTPGPGLKRNASHLSDSPSAVQQSRKRLRRHEVPPWARSARERAPKFGDGSRRARVEAAAPPPAISHAQPQHRAQSQPPTQNQAPPQAQPQPPPPAQIPPQDPITNGHPVPVPERGSSDATVLTRWEPTIANMVPDDDMSRAISHWIYSFIGNKVPPAGAVFEIEAKIGEIVDIREGRRLHLPVRSETIFNKDQYGGSKFESSMNMEQHRLLNHYLNNLAQVAYNDPGRESIRPCHLRELDDFFELNEEGRRNLTPAMQSDTRRSTPRVRVTTDKETGEIRAKIIKSRLADLEVYNPNFDFDFRISISLESAWEGDNSWLIPMNNANARTRLKDRMSYRHAAIQVDLTQVSHEDSQQMEHELEVEVSVVMLQAELEKDRKGQPNRYFDLVKSLIDNTRLLCRQGSLPRG